MPTTFQRPFDSPAPAFALAYAHFRFSDRPAKRKPVAVDEQPDIVAPAAYRNDRLDVMASETPSPLADNFNRKYVKLHKYTRDEY